MPYTWVTWRLKQQASNRLDFDWKNRSYTRITNILTNFLNKYNTLQSVSARCCTIISQTNSSYFYLFTAVGAWHTADLVVPVCGRCVVYSVTGAASVTCSRSSRQVVYTNWCSIALVTEFTIFTGTKSSNFRSVSSSVWCIVITQLSSIIMLWSWTGCWHFSWCFRLTS